MSHLGLARDFYSYLRSRGKLFLAPIIFVLVILGLLIVLSASSAFAPFIYALF